MKPISTMLVDSGALRVALRVLSSEELLQLNEEIEALTLERIEEEEVLRQRKEQIAEFRVLLAEAGITPKELLAFTRGSISASKRL